MDYEFVVCLLKQCSNVQYGSVVAKWVVSQSESESGRITLQFTTQKATQSNKISTEKNSKAWFDDMTVDCVSSFFIILVVSVISILYSYKFTTLSMIKTVLTEKII